MRVRLLPTSSEWSRSPETYIALAAELDELGYRSQIAAERPDADKRDSTADLELHFEADTPGHAQADALAKLVRRRLERTKHFSIYAGSGELLRQGWSM